VTFDSHSITDQELDAYLDGLLEPAERSAFEQRLRAHPELEREVQQFTELDIKIRRIFPPEQVSEKQIEQLIGNLTNSPNSKILSEPQHRSPTVALRAVLIGLAATLAWVLVIWQWGDPPVETPYFEPKPVAQVYHEVLSNGFEPYYECHDDQRFADTFLRRQGQALRLAALPQGSHMLGLSYAGGLSRDTTAMLCRVNGEPVMVFVDQLEKDSPLALQNHSSETQVHRVAHGGLVFYEVTPFDDARVIEYLIAQ
jgi:hypothetical protein